MRSTEIVRVGQSFEDSSEIKVPETVTHLPGYFYEKQKADSRFKGLYAVSANLIPQMDDMAEQARGGEVVGSPIPLNPAKSGFSPEDPAYLNKVKDAAAYKLYESDDPTGSQALVNLTYHLTNAQELHDTRRGREGFVVMQLQYDGSEIFFIEHHSKDTRQRSYMQWSVANGVPAEVYDAELERKAATQKIYFARAVKNGLEALEVLDKEPDRLGRAA